MNWPKNFLTYTASNFLTEMFPIWEHTFKQLLRVCYYSICHFISCFVLTENWKMKWIGINSPGIKILNFCRTRLPPKLDFPIWWDTSYGKSFEIMSWIFFLMIHTPQDFFYGYKHQDWLYVLKHFVKCRIFNQCFNVGTSPG